MLEVRKLNIHKTMIKCQFMIQLEPLKPVKVFALAEKTCIFQRENPGFLGQCGHTHCLAISHLKLSIACVDIIFFDANVFS